jgi:hypothetical protein
MTLALLQPEAGGAIIISRFLIKSLPVSLLQTIQHTAQKMVGPILVSLSQILQRLLIIINIVLWLVTAV